MHITQEHGPPIYGPEHVLPPAANAEAGLAVPAAAGAVTGAHHSSCSGQQSTGYSLQPKETVQPDRALGSDAAEDSATQHLLLGGQSQDHWWSRAVSNMTDVSGIDSSPELVKNMSVDDIIGHWRGFVKAFTRELALCNHRYPGAELSIHSCCSLSRCSTMTCSRIPVDWHDKRQTNELVLACALQMNS